MSTPASIGLSLETTPAGQSSTAVTAVVAGIAGLVLGAIGMFLVAGQTSGAWPFGERTTPMDAVLASGLWDATDIGTLESQSLGWSVGNTSNVSGDVTYVFEDGVDGFAALTEIAEAEGFMLGDVENSDFDGIEYVEIAGSKSDDDVVMYVYITKYDFAERIYVNISASPSANASQ